MSACSLAFLQSWLHSQQSPNKEALAAIHDISEGQRIVRISVLGDSQNMELFVDQGHFIVAWKLSVSCIIFVAYLDLYFGLGSTFLSKNPFLDLIAILAVATLNVLWCFDKVMNLSIESQIFRPVYFFVHHFGFSNLSDHHFQSADFGVIDFAEIIEDSYQIKSLEGKYIAMISCKGTHHDLVLAHVIRA